ncbi:MAG: tyrosine-type recombinase/integrase [Planctomycetaceae bacterium]
MPRKSSSVPAYCLHRHSGKAIVRIAGRDHYLGPHGSPESRAEYDRLIAEWLACGRQSATSALPAENKSLLVNEVLLAYVEFAEKHYSDGQQVSTEFANLKHAIKPVKQLYGHTAAEHFGPLALKAIRQHMIEVQKLSRKEINKRIGRIKRVFKWAVSEELIPPSVFEGLRSVDGLRMGRTTARETKPVRPVDDTVIEATLRYTSPQIAAMIQLQRLTGMRPGEVTSVRKEVPLGPKTQELLTPFLQRAADAYLFSPRESEEWRNSQRVTKRNPNRKTKVFPCELRARERRRQAKRKPRRSPIHEQYNTISYRRAICHAIAKAKRAGVAIPHWHPHQLRHTRATEVRRRYGVEAAQVSLCHSRADVTEIYAERNFGLAAKIAKEMG